MHPNHDLAWFLLSATGLILYLIFSALTEMGTKWPWQWPWHTGPKQK
jgi:hypothetical protein